MERDSKKKITPNIDENLMMNIMAGGVKKEGIKLPDEATSEPERSEQVQKEPAAKKPDGREKLKQIKNSEADYESIFLKKTDSNARDGKTVYIRPDFHDKLSRILHVIGEDKISIYAYLNNLLEHHFQEFSDQITKSYNDKHRPI